MISLTDVSREVIFKLFSREEKKKKTKINP